VLAAALGVVMVDPAFGYVTLLAAVVGHAFPIFHRFRGGKSVATALGGFVVLAPVVGVTLTVIWAVILIVWKTASVGSIIVMVLAVPLLALAGRRGSDLVWSAAIVVFVLIRHSGNIRRLVQRSERKVV
jgi:glycerol-3-phosphate acyltransferase PlsY